MAIWMRCLVCMKNVPSEVVYTEPLNRGYANQFGWSSNGEHDKSAMHGNWDERKKSSELDIILVDWNELWMIADVRYRNKNNDSGSGEQKKTQTPCTINGIRVHKQASRHNPHISAAATAVATAPLYVMHFCFQLVDVPHSLLQCLCIVQLSYTQTRARAQASWQPWYNRPSSGRDF